MRTLGMDLGTKTLGLALSDKLGIIANPYKTLRYNDIDELVSEVTTLIDELKVEDLVLGYPKNMNNTLGEAVERTLTFKEKLEASINKTVNLVDERLSTVEAERALIGADMSRKNRKEVIDSVAASIILDTYLKRIGSGK
jgi:RNAse H domain protein, YqgF family